MRRLLLFLWMLLPFLAILVTPLAAQAADPDGACAHNGRDPCYVVHMSVRDYPCAPISQEDLTKAAFAGTNVAAAERTARVVCVEQYEAEVLHVLHSGSFGPDGNDRAYSVGLDEVKIMSVEKRH